MRRGTLIRLAGPLTAILVATAGARAQEPAPVYLQAEALRWRVADAPLPVPLLTAANPNVAGATGALDETGTLVLLGGQGIGFGVGTGTRVTLGAWLAEGACVELTYLTLGQRTATRFFDDPSGTARLGLPFINALTGAASVNQLSTPSSMTPSTTIFDPETETTITIPGVVTPGLSGQVRFATRTELTGVEGNGWLTIARDGFRVEGLAGARVLRLEEDLVLEASSLALPGIPGDVFALRDQFSTRNTFYGAQVGFRLSADVDVVFFSLVGKVAAGPMLQEVSVAGDLVTNQLPPGPLAVFPGGNYAQRSNIGTSQVTRFATVSELQANTGIQIAPALRVFAGYSLLYASSVARPGAQVDPYINPNQSEALLFMATPPGIGGGPVAPTRNVNSSSYWAQGWSFGLEVRY